MPTDGGDIRLKRDPGHNLFQVLHSSANLRLPGGGAINGLMNELIEGEVRYHVLSPRAKPGSNRAEAAERLIQVLHTYLK
jgi:hypothetical protein